MVVRSFNVAVSNFRAAVGDITKYAVIGRSSIFINNAEVFNYRVAEYLTYQTACHQLKAQGVTLTVQNTVETVGCREIGTCRLGKGKLFNARTQVLRYDIVTVNVGGYCGMGRRIFFAGYCRIVEEFREVRQFVNNACVGFYRQLIGIPCRRFREENGLSYCVCLNFFRRQSDCARPSAVSKIDSAFCIVSGNKRFTAVCNDCRHNHFAIRRRIEQFVFNNLYVFLVVNGNRYVLGALPSKLIVFFAPIVVVKAACIRNVRKRYKKFIAVAVVRLSPTIRIYFREVCRHTKARQGSTPAN